jgi:hypothetical protein
MKKQKITSIDCENKSPTECLTELKKEKRVVNIDKSDFDIIKKFCDDNSLNMSRWISNITRQEVEKNQQSKTIKAKIHELVGEASMCWIPIPSGEFNSTLALRVADDLVELTLPSKK